METNAQRRRVIAVIPARGGSKRLPGKNMLLLGGKPLIAWTVDAALCSGVCDTVCVSTDDEAIAQAARQAGAHVPFVRPADIAGDEASSVDVVRHALGWYRGRGDEYATVVLLQPTSPLRTAEDVAAAVRLFVDRCASAVVSVCACDHPPQWTNVLPADGSMSGFMADSVKGKRSQDLPTHYRINGAVYVISVDVFEREKTFLPDLGSFAYVMPMDRSVDIDTKLDLAFARVLVDEASA